MEFGLGRGSGPERSGKVTRSMENEEKQWIDAALDRAVRADKEGILILMVRKQDSNDQADIVITNAKTGDMVAALYPDSGSDE